MSTPDWPDMSDFEETDGGLMTRREVAEFLAVSVRTVQRMEAHETLIRVDVPGVRGARYRRREVEALISGDRTGKTWGGVEGWRR